MPRAYVPRNASVCSAGAGAAVDAPVALAWFVVVVGGAGPARGRESVAMMTPDETTANAILRTKRERRERRQSSQHASAGPVGGVGVEGK